MSESSVSVVIPVHNGAKYLRECVASVLGQTLAPLEVIIVDDGSTDATPEIALSLGAPVRLLRQDRQGPAAARNAGAEAASGRFLAFIDADDIWEPDKLALQMDRFRSHPSGGIVFGFIRQFHSPETDDVFRSRYHCPPGPGPGLHPGTMLIQREDFFRIGPFDATLRAGEFLEWHDRAQSMGFAACMLEQVVAHRRIHPSNYGITHKHFRSDYLRVVQTIMKRKRS